MEMLILVSVLAVARFATPFPKDLQPINRVNAEESRLFPAFQGWVLEGDADRLGLDFQHMIRMRHMLYIAGREHVFAVNLSTTKDQIIPQQRLTWKSKDVSKCRVRGRNRDECYNYIKVLVPRNDETLFVCGTNAFSPTCRNYRLSSLEQVGEELAGQARCPFASHQANLGIFAGGHFYSATVWDVQASDSALYRSLGGEGSPVLRTVKYDSKWLREPRFLHAVEYGNYVYFFFSEISVEYTSLGKVVFSRVARVCKNDNGGSPRVLDGYWTSFLKARLNCSVPGESFFYFDALQSVTGILQVNQRPAVVGVFTTQINSIPGSAVCGFYMDEMERVFQGRFKEHKSGDSGWTAVSKEQVPKPRPGSCAGEGSASSYSSSVMFPDVMLSFIKAHPLMEECVSSITSQPFLTHTNSSFKLTHIVMDAAAGPYRNRTVMFLGSDDGHVLKVLLNPQPDTPHISTLLEEIHVYNPTKCNGSSRVLGLELDTQHHALYVAFSSCVIRVPLSRCTQHRTCKSRCLSSRDPYCIWLWTGSCADVAPGLNAGFEQDIDGKSSHGPDICSDMVSNVGKHNLALDSATAVTGFPSRESAISRVHYTLLIVCVLVAFVCGVFLSALLMWCYCGQTAKHQAHHGKKSEASLPQVLSLDGLAKLGNLLDTHGQRVSTQSYTSVLSQAEQYGASTASNMVTTPRRCSQEVRLPTPDPTTQLLNKSINAFQWESISNPQCVSRQALMKHVLPQSLPHSQSATVTPCSNQSVTPQQSVDLSEEFFNKQSDTLVLSGNQSSASTLCINQSTAPSLVPGERAYQGMVDMTFVQDCLKHVHDEMGGAKPFKGHSKDVTRSAQLAKATDSQSGDVATSRSDGAAAESHRTTHRQLERNGQEPYHQQCPVSCSTHRLSLIKTGGRAAMARQHSFKQQGAPQHRLMQVSSGKRPATSDGVELGRESYLPLVSGASCLTRQHSYSEAAPHGVAIVRRTASLKPQLPSKLLYLPSSPTHPTYLSGVAPVTSSPDS